MGSCSLPAEGSSRNMKLNFVVGCCLVVMSHLSTTAQARLSNREIIDRAVGRLNDCERAIWSCCQTDRPTHRFPTRCFESNGCTGLFFMGVQQVCSNEFLTAIGAKIQHTAMEIRDLDRNDVAGARSGYASEPIKYVAA